jgi:hypothetical protein
LQGTNGHADQLGDLLSALSSLNEVPDLLESLRSKLSSTTVGIRHRHGCTPFGSRVVVVVYISIVLVPGLGLGFNEQIFGADEQARARSASRVELAC